MRNLPSFNPSQYGCVSTSVDGMSKRAVVTILMGRLRASLPFGRCAVVSRQHRDRFALDLGLALLVDHRAVEHHLVARALLAHGDVRGQHLAGPGLLREAD